MRTIAVPVGQVAIDLHVHTSYSKDSLTSNADLIRAVQRRGLTGVAITDHNRLDGALRFRDQAPFPVIPGEEIRTCDGEVIGLFLERAIPAGMTPEETVAAIRDQHGVVYLPHPSDRARRSVMASSGTDRIIDDVDVVEVLNSRVLLKADNDAALRLAERHGKARGAGSDAHTAAEVGTACVLMPSCDLGDPRAFMEAIVAGRVIGDVSSRLVHLASTLAKVAKRVGIGLPPAGRR